MEEDKNGRDSLQDGEEQRKNKLRVGLPLALALCHEIQTTTNLQAVASHNSQQGVGGRKHGVVEGASTAYDGDDRSGGYSRKKVPMQHNLNENNSSESHAPKDKLNVLQHCCCLGARRYCLDCRVLAHEDEIHRRCVYR